MSKWKPWQQLAFLAYLLLLNITIFGALAFLLLGTFRTRSQAPADLAAAPVPNTFVMLPTSTPLPPPAPLAAPNVVEASQLISTSNAMPPLNILPLSVPTQANGVVTPTAQVTLVITEGSRSQAWTATPTVPLTTPQPTTTTQPLAIAQEETDTAIPTPTYTHTPKPTATSTRTPTPSSTPTPTSTRDPQPTTTSTLTPTHTPQPGTQPPHPQVAYGSGTATPTRTPRLSATPTLPPISQVVAEIVKPHSTRRPQSVTIPTPLSTLPPTATPEPTSTPTQRLTRTPQPMATPKATAMAKLILTPTPLPTVRPKPQPTPLVVAAALKSDTTETASDTSAGLAPANLDVATAAGLVEAVSLTNGSIALSWSLAGRTAQYRIYSDMGSGYGVYLYKAEVNEPAFVDKFLRPGILYSYRVTHLKTHQEIVLAQTHTAATGGGMIIPDSLPTQEIPPAKTVAPAPTALPPDAVILGLVSDNSFTDDFNTLSIVGEVRNDSNLDVGQAHIAVTFYNEVGAVIGSAEGKTMFEVIPPGEISPFLITLSRPTGLASYSLRAVARPVTPRLGAQLSVVQVKRFEDEAGFFHIKGVVENTGRVVAERTKVVAMIYGRDNGIINLGFTYVDPPTLAPAARATYEVIFTYYPRYVTQRVIPFEE